MDLELFLLLVAAYLLGSIPFGMLLSYVMKTGDLRKIGSGNIGATNALRTGNKKLAGLTLLLDILKGTLAVLIIQPFAPDMAYLAGFLAVLGHICPVWLKFKGGKGVATSLGILLALSPIIFSIMVITWYAVFHFTRISSLSALIAFLLAPMFAYVSGDMMLALMMLGVSVLIFYKHRDNLGRIVRGEEMAIPKKERADE